MLFISISAIISILIIIALIHNGYYAFLAMWIGFVVVFIVLSWLAVIIIKPRYPRWWSRHIAAEISNDLIKI